MAEAIRMGKRGTMVLPAHTRKRLGLVEGSLILVEDQETGVTLRPAVLLAVEAYSPERKAAFLLENAVDDEDYARAVAEVERMGLDPLHVPHGRP